MNLIVKERDKERKSKREQDLIISRSIKDEAEQINTQNEILDASQITFKNIGNKQVQNLHNNSIIHTEEIPTLLEWSYKSRKLFAERILQNEAINIQYDRYSLMS
jgi:hypothetical protein